MKRTLQPPATSQRHGTLLLAVLACLTVCAMLLTFWLRLIAIERRQVRSNQSAMQTELLADAAVTRAVRRVQADADYTGETWRPATDSLAASQVIITVAPAGEGSASRQLEVSAEIGVGSNLFVRRSRAQPITIPAEEPAP
jgi:hypothetical protein